MGTPPLSQRPFHTHPIDVRSKTLTPELQATLSSQKKKKKENFFLTPTQKGPDSLETLVFVSLIASSDSALWAVWMACP